MGKKRSVHTVRKFDPHSISPSQRASEYPSEHLVQSSGKLFCKACRETLAVKSIVSVVFDGTTRLGEVLAIVV